MRVEVLYADHEGGERTITRFGILPAGEGQQPLCVVTRHWNLDRSEISPGDPVAARVRARRYGWVAEME